MKICRCWKATFIVAFLLFGRPAHAQIYRPEVTFKDSLVQLLFQYGKEVYYRGVDPQEASYVFQRIISLDCHHQGAQEFLSKIRERYPNVSIKIEGCEESKITVVSPEVPDQIRDLDEDKVIIIRKDDRYLPGSFVPAISNDDQEAIHGSERATPLRAFSEPLSYKAQWEEDEDSLHEADSGTISEDSISPVPYGKSLDHDCEVLRTANIQLQNEIYDLKSQIQLKDETIKQIQEQLTLHQGKDSSYFLSIAEDQKNLIRVQQGNIDYLQKELDDVKEQVLEGDSNEDPAYVSLHREIASSQLLAHEKEMHLEAKNKEAFLLQKQLGELQEQLQLVKKILNEKNEMIKSLEDELESIKLESGK